MAGWEEDDLDEIIDQALTAPPIAILPSKDDPMKDEPAVNHGGSDDEVALVSKIEHSVVEPATVEQKAKESGQSGWLDDDLDLDISEETAKVILPESNDEQIPDVKVKEGWSDEELIVDGPDSGVNGEQPAEIPRDNQDLLEPEPRSIFTLKDGWAEDGLDIPIPPVVNVESPHSLGATKALVHFGWEEDELDLDDSLFDGPAIAPEPENLEKIKTLQENSTAMENIGLDETLGRKIIETKIEPEISENEEETDDPMTKTHFEEQNSAVKAGWDDDELNLFDVPVADLDKPVAHVVDHALPDDASKEFDSEIPIPFQTAPQIEAPIKTVIGPLVAEESIKVGWEDDELDAVLAVNDDPVTLTDVTPDSQATPDDGINSEELKPSDTEDGDHNSDVPDSPLPLSEKAPSGWQNDDFELDFPEQALASESDPDVGKTGASSSSLDFDEQPDDRIVESAPVASEVTPRGERDIHQQRPREPPLKMAVHPSVSMGWLDGDLDIPDFPSMDAVSTPRILKVDQNDVNNESTDIREDEIPRRSLYDEFPTEPAAGWDEDELELSEGENGWATDHIKLTTSENSGVSPEDFIGAYQKVNDVESTRTDEDDVISPDMFSSAYIKQTGSAEEPDKEKDEELTSPTQWFSGVLKTIGSDLKSKTVAGLDKLYEALDTVPESGTSSVPISEAGSEESANKFKGLLDQFSPTVDDDDENEGVTYVASEEEEEEMSVTDGEVAVGDKFRGLFGTIRPSGDDHLGRMMGKIGQTTLSLASHTKNKLTPAMHDFASKVKRKITEMPKRRLKREDLDVDARKLLFREPEAMEALETIQITACKNSIELKRMRKAGRTIAPLFRDDPLASIHQSNFQLDSNEGWQSFESRCGVEFALSHKVEMSKLLLLARNSGDSMMEIYSNLDSAPERLNPELYLAIRLFAYRQIIADFTRLSLELLAMVSDNASEEAVTTMIKVFLSELELIRTLAQQPSEDVAFTFPELGEDVLSSCTVVISERLDIKPLLSIIREVYYAYEPIVALNTLK